jgi:fructose-1,6-bisphosphatase
LVASPGVYTFSGSSVLLKTGRVLVAAPGSYVLNGSDAQLVYFAGTNPAIHYTLNAEPGVYSLVGSDTQFIKVKGMYRGKWVAS